MSMLPLFDTYVMVDWSAKNRPTTVAPQENAIWWAVHPLRKETRPVFTGKQMGDGSQQMGDGSRVFDSDDKVGVEIYERTRHTAIENIKKFLRCEVEKERRVLVGFDFAFGYPRGFAELITGKPCALELWEALSVRHDHDNSIVIDINDKKNTIVIDVNDKKNTSNRFAVAAELNRRITVSAKDKDPCVSYGPFWGFPGGIGMERPPFDPYCKAQRPKSKQHLPQLRWPAAGFGFKRKRITDKKAAGAKSVFQLNGNGSVGSQAILGMRYLHGLRCHVKKWDGMKDRCVVWPFQTGFECPVSETSSSSPSIVIVEIYPSFLKKHYEGEPGVTDRAQVRVNARAFAHLDHDDSTLFRSLFQGPRDLSDVDRKSVTEEEGWILGAGFQREIDDALRGWNRGEP